MGDFNVDMANLNRYLSHIFVGELIVLNQEEKINGFGIEENHFTFGAKIIYPVDNLVVVVIGDFNVP